MKYLVLLCVLITVSLVASLQFDCRRENQDCDNGGNCNNTNGECECGSRYTGFMCQIDTEDDDTDCEDTCDTDYCYDDGLNNCLCPEETYGPTCEYRRFQHECPTADTIQINANVIGADAIFVFDEVTCPLNATGSDVPDGWEGAVKVIDVPSDTNCGDIVPIENEDGTSTYCVTAYIRYRDDYWTGLDTAVTYCCSGTEVSGITITSIDVDKDLPGTTVPTKVVGSSDIDVKVYSDGEEVTGSVKIGERVIVELRLKSDAVSVGLKPLECTLQDAASSPDDSVRVVEDGCATDALDGFSLAYNDLDSYDLLFNMIKFFSSNKVFLVCKMRLCINGPNCDDDCGRRKRRDVISNATSETDSTSETTENIIYQIEVEDPFLKNEEEEAKMEEMDTQETTINMSAAVIGLGAVVLLLLAVCLILSILLINKRRSPDLKA